MRAWLRETHGVQFELLRHFLRQLFDSEMITAPEQSRSALIGVVSLSLPWFQLLYGPLKAKYAYFSVLPLPGPYREAVRADELWLITLMMSIIGLLTAVKWQSLFPDLRDYRVLGALPLRSRQIFVAKLLALLAAAAGALILVNAFPSSAFPMLSNSRWAFHPEPGARMRAYALASVAGGAFFFFALVALQGVLLNLLRPRVFRRVTGYLQGLLVGVMLSLIVLSFSIQPRIANTLVQPEWSRWLPPLWFLGLCQARSGDPDPAMRSLAQRGVIAPFAALALALCTYLLSYRRHRALLMEGAPAPAKRRRSGGLLGLMLRDPRQQGVVGFMIHTLTRSSYHRMILMGYGGVAFATLVSGMIGMGSIVGNIGMGTFAGRERLAAGSFVYYHLITLLFLLLGARHLFSRPTELKANWLFQITEREGRGEWLLAVDRFVLFWGALLWAAPLRLELRWLGWRGVAEAALSLALGRLAYDWFFAGWNKLPFTCSHLPGKTAGWLLALRFFALIALGPALQALLLAALYNSLAYVFVLSAVIVAGTAVRALRRDGWAELRLQFDELPEPEINGLNLLP